MIALLAAGAGQRMGGADKLTKLWRGKPLLSHVMGAARRGAPQVPILVMLRPQDFAKRARCLHGYGARKVLVPQAANGMSASLRRAAQIALAAKAEGLIVIPGDLAGLNAATLAQIRREFARAPSSPVRGWDGSGFGHPTALPRSLFHKLLTLNGNNGARDILRSARRLKFSGARRDFDRPADFD